MNEKLKPSYLWVGLIALIHLPMVVIQYMRLWSYEHYQFFPFAFVAFGWLVASRRVKGVFEWRIQSTVLLVLDLIFLAAGYYLNSPWLVCIGAVYLCFSVCSALQDSEAHSSLAYLVLLPLITIRLPLAMDTQIIQWLQKATTHVASDLLNHFGYLHLREGNILEFPGKRFLVEEACSGVQSLFTLLFLATLIVCGYRRKWLHSILVLFSAFCFAGLMNVMRVASVSMAWISLEVDLSTGWQHDAIGYIALIVAAFLVFSADAFLNLICAPVPDFPGGGLAAAFLNPVTAVWNWCFLVRIGGREVKQDDDESQQGAQRELPRFADMLMPRNLFGWMWNFVESWFLSRELKLLASSTPFLLAGICGAAFMWWLQTSPKDQLVDMYEQASVDASRSDDAEGKRIYLESLVRLRPADLQHRFELAMHLIQNQQTERALSQIQVLTQPGPNDFAPARVWLAQQAMLPEPVVPLSLQQIEEQLVQALNLQPKNVPAKQLLADVLIKKGQLKGAEIHLLDVVDQEPGLLLPLARLQKELRRSEEQIQFHLTAATEFFEKELMKEPRNTRTRISLAESMLMSDRLNDSERILLEGLSDEDTPELRSALAMFYCQIATARMKTSTLNSELCAELIGKALRLTPTNQIVLANALTLNGMGVPVDAELLTPAIVELQAAESPSDQQQLLLVRALAANKQFEEAITRLESLATDVPELKFMYARLLQAADRTEDFETLVEQSLAEIGMRDATPTVDSSLNTAEFLGIANRFAESLSLLKTIEQNVNASSPVQLQRWKILFSRATFAMYDSRLDAGEFQTPQEALELLNQALETGVASIGVLERLVKLSFTDGEFAKPAEEALDQLLVKGSANAEIYNIIGSQALEKKQISKARRYLELAYNLSRANPMVLNNLALALVYDDNADHQRALRLVNDALELIPSHPDVLSTRAEVYMRLERWEDARTDLETALPKRPNSITCHRLLGQVCEKMGDSSLAAAHRQRVAELTDLSEPAKP